MLKVVNLKDGLVVVEEILVLQGMGNESGGTICGVKGDRKFTLKLDSQRVCCLLHSLVAILLVIQVLDYCIGGMHLSVQYVQIVLDSCVQFLGTFFRCH